MPLDTAGHVQHGRGPRVFRRPPRQHARDRLPCGSAGAGARLAADHPSAGCRPPAGPRSPATARGTVPQTYAGSGPPPAPGRTPSSASVHCPARRATSPIPYFRTVVNPPRNGRPPTATVPAPPAGSTRTGCRPAAQARRSACLKARATRELARHHEAFFNGSLIMTTEQDTIARGTALPAAPWSHNSILGK